jgi:hypothetical protein
VVTSAEEIVGTWLSRRTYYIGFYEDGTCPQAHALDKLDSAPYAVNRFWFEGTQMHLETISVSGVPSCGDIVGIYEMRFLEDDKMQIARIEDKCSPRARDTAGVYERVSPPASEPTQTVEPQATTTSTEATAFPIGTFTMEDHDGKWLIVFKDDGSFRVTINGQPMVRRGSYTVSGDQITLSDDSVPCAGKGDGTYRWTFDGKMLTWEVVKDRCIARKGTHDGSTWSKRP